MKIISCKENKWYSNYFYDIIEWYHGFLARFFPRLLYRHIMFDGRWIYWDRWISKRTNDRIEKEAEELSKLFEEYDKNIPI